MSSELTIDIQLTELGFSSWDFQLLKQKETPPPNGSASVLEGSSALFSSSVENHVREETQVSVGQNAISPISQDPQIHADDAHTDTVAFRVGRKDPWLKNGGTECNDDDQQKNENFIKEMNEDQKCLRQTNGNWEIDVAVNDEDDEEEEDERNLIDDDDDDDDDLSSDTNGSEEHRCHVCDLTFSTPFLLREHLHVHTGVRPYCCAECGKQFCHLANYRAHLRSHATFCCLICSARFATQELLQGHLDTNHFEKEFYQCDFCKRIFVSLQECEEHVQSHKQEVRRYPCPKCDRSFHHHSSLYRHLKWHKQSALICTDCGQVFPKKISLLRHSFSHLGLLPYTCVHCKRHYRLASLYRKHECKPENIQCVACLVVFQSQDDFDKHKKHTGCWGHQISSPGKTSDIRCMECGQIFTSSQELKKHAGTHQRVMKCSECGMGFRSSLMLMSHMGGHAANCPCLCKECGLGFPHQHAYDSHLKTCGLDTPLEPSVKKMKPKSKALPTLKKKEIIIAPKSTALQSVTLEPQKEVSQGVVLHTVASAGNPTTPNEGPWTFVVNKEHLPGTAPLVMLVPTSISSTSKGIQNSQDLVSSAVSEEHLSLSNETAVPLASTSQSPLASIKQFVKSDKPVLVQGVASPSANVLIPLAANASSPKIRWTVLEDQQTSGSVSNMTKGNKSVVALVQSDVINMSEVLTENEQNIQSSLRISSTLHKNGSVKAKPKLPKMTTTKTHNPEMPLCLVKIKTEPHDRYNEQSRSKPDGSNSSLEIKSDSTVVGANNVSGSSEIIPAIPQIPKKESAPWEERQPHSVEKGVKKDLCQCEICGIVLLEENMDHHMLKHSVTLDSDTFCHSLPSGPPSKRLNLG